jgi:hypothetical protein
MTRETELCAFSLSSYPDQTRETRIGTSPPVKGPIEKDRFLRSFGAPSSAGLKPGLNNHEFYKQFHDRGWMMA